MPIETPSDGLDLLAMREAETALTDAAARLRAEAILARLAPSLAPLPPALRQAMEQLAREVGAVSAVAEAARQGAMENRRDRGDWLQIDPLRHIPEDRSAPPPAPPEAVQIHAADPGFIGYGWHSAEGHGRESWRWSGLAPAASVVLPDLGSGRVELEFDLELPFRQPLNEGAITILANGEPLELAMALRDGHRGSFSAIWEGAEAPGASLGLVLLGPLVMDPTGRDTRKLGIGFRSLSARPAGRRRG